jgi:DNA-binding NarL/FixJ family response regulator
MIREGTAAVINMEPDLVLCGTAATATEAFANIPKAKPDVIVVDLSLEGRSGLELIKSLRSHYPKLPVVVYTMHEEALYGERAAASGASGYVTKRQPSAKLLAAIRQVAHAGGRGSRPSSTRRAPKSAGGKAASPLSSLSDRELEVFELRGQGLAGNQIATRLHLSRKTVDTHLENIKHKLNLADSGELLQRAVQWMHSQHRV